MSILLRANKEAHSENTLRLHTGKGTITCTCNNLEFKKYLAELGTDLDLTTITGITYTDVEGNEQTLELTVESNDKKAFRKALQSALDSIGYDPHFEDNYRGVTVTDDNVLCLIGNFAATSVIVEGAEPITFESRCEEARLCKYQFMLPKVGDTTTVQLNDVEIDGTSETLADDIAAVLTDAESIEVTDNTDFCLVTVESFTEFTVDGENPTLCGCRREWIPDTTEDDKSSEKAATEKLKSAEVKITEKDAEIKELKKSLASQKGQTTKLNKKIEELTVKINSDIPEKPSVESTEDNNDGSNENQ